jgi:hypothetical protein
LQGLLAHIVGLINKLGQLEEQRRLQRRLRDRRVCADVKGAENASASKTQAAFMTGAQKLYSTLIISCGAAAACQKKSAAGAMRGVIAFVEQVVDIQPERHSAAEQVVPAPDCRLVRV